jgi:glutathione S-transferase
MDIVLYLIPLSHPAEAARQMLEYKGIEYRAVSLLPGMHPAQVRLRGFRRATVPAMKVDGRRIQGSRQIAAFLDELVPDPPLFPSDPAARRAVQEAEAWGERSLQAVPRRLVRWGAGRETGVRIWIAELVGMPLPPVMAALNLPVARVLGARVNATDEQVRADLAALPGLLDHVDALIADGIIGGEQPNAADFQIGTSVRVLRELPGLTELVQGRPCEAVALRVMPEFPPGIPRFLPEAWIPPAPAPTAVT